MLKKLILLLLVPLATQGQQAIRLQPGKMYEAGETLFAPHYGFTSTVPVGWSGLLPRDSEVFLLTSETMPAEIFVFAREQGDVTTMKKDWEKGFEMDVDLRLQAKAAKIMDKVLSSEVIMEGNNTDKSKRGYAIVRCGDYGPCVTCLATMAAGNYDAVKKVTDQFISSGKFDNPSNISTYADFDWKKFLSGKTLTTYAIQGDGSKETSVNLCPEGTFKADISKKGIMKNLNPEYKGKLTGSWTVEGMGEKGKLHLEFKKKGLAAIDVPLRITDEKIYANEERYFVADGDDHICH